MASFDQLKNIDVLNTLIICGIVIIIIIIISNYIKINTANSTYFSNLQHHNTQNKTELVENSKCTIPTNTNQPQIEPQIEPQIDNNNSNNGNNNDNKSILTLYYADWCGYSRIFLPEWNKIKNSELKKIVAFEEYESDKYPDKCRENNIMGYPTILLHTPKKTISLPNSTPRTLDGIFRFVKNNI